MVEVFGTLGGLSKRRDMRPATLMARHGTD